MAVGLFYTLSNESGTFDIVTIRSSSSSNSNHWHHHEPLYQTVCWENLAKIWNFRNTQCLWVMSVRVYHEWGLIQTQFLRSYCRFHQQPLALSPWYSHHSISIITSHFIRQCVGKVWPISGQSLLTEPEVRVSYLSPLDVRMPKKTEKHKFLSFTQKTWGGEISYFWRKRKPFY